MLTTAQLRQRKSGIGGSDAAAILGLSHWTSNVELYFDKITKHVPDQEQEPTESQHFGNILEEVVAKEAARREGWKIQKRNKHYKHPHYPWMLANIDRAIVGKKEGLEIKTASEFNAAAWGEEGTDDLPAYYLIQCHHYMIVLGYLTWHLAVLIGGNKYKRYTIHANKDLHDYLIEQEKVFWNDHVLKKIPPEPKSASDLLLLYPNDNGDVIEATSEIVDLCERIQDHKQAVKEIEEYQKADEFKLKEFIKDNTVISFEEKVLGTFKQQDTTRLNGKKFKKDEPELHELYCNTTSSRVLRLKK